MPLIPAFEIGVGNAWIFTVWLLLQNVAIRLWSREVSRRGGQPTDMKVGRLRRLSGYVSMPLWLLTTVYSVFLPLRLGAAWFCLGLAVFLPGLIMATVTIVNFLVALAGKPITRGLTVTHRTRCMCLGC
ncbi:hypothetical protein ACFLW3_01715 [Chloroflexota bacterium]